MRMLELITATRKALGIMPLVPPLEKIYAHAGERVTCENGHHIATFDEAVYSGHSMENIDEQLADWQQIPPIIGESIPSCAVCGAAFCDNYGQFHFKGGWRGEDF